MTKKLDGFRFKQFQIEHSLCAMKVGTDGILLGSWAEPGPSTKLLDIGTGSGLLAIMLAQKSPCEAKIYGIDIDAAAIKQACHNAAECPWPSKLSFDVLPIQSLPANQQYDFIISNPPFFVAKRGELAPADANYMTTTRRQARHLDSLNLDQLMQAVRGCLSPQGQFNCILPAQAKQIDELAEAHGLYCQRRTWVFSKANKPAIRQLLCFSKFQNDILQDNLVIHTDAGGYSDSYKQLCQGFYLNF
ncbi:methyltransferase domain-containing protein [Aliiglaciecola sp. LCG003]|uniref:tRNA1(Val) (adenine(37)-N6)-methyltransferase n=1 Tax=Aliiglaciecola sp. LCG003 TaxID=3053655 RepID=UPI00257475AB|nr:methyltransferase domain-containing protein [Aliiglaciecola sp. LCG003]WJG08975.1 methyltransferase domain-containing protein [Aliiglaciecola sp. LCG003]